jgi:uncharacterized protein DUF5343
MAIMKNALPKKEPRKNVRAETDPKFPYTTKPSSLRRLLQAIPSRPKPPKYDAALLRSWGFSDTNDYTVLRVLKAIGLLNASNEPTELYSKYMHLQGGATALAEPVKRIYEPLFNASHKPYAESPEQLKNLFNIHSGGSDRALEQQIQTFKALCENTIFDGAADPVVATGNGATATQRALGGVTPSLTGAGININVHIHLPENKSSRDYEAIIEDIGRYIFGRKETAKGE